MVQSVVIEVDANNIEASINAVLTSLGLSATQFLQALTIQFGEKNQTAKIVIFYDKA